MSFFVWCIAKSVFFFNIFKEFWKGIYWETLGMGWLWLYYWLTLKFDLFSPFPSLNTLSIQLGIILLSGKSHYLVISCGASVYFKVIYLWYLFFIKKKKQVSLWNFILFTLFLPLLIISTSQNLKKKKFPPRIVALMNLNHITYIFI